MLNDIEFNDPSANLKPLPIRKAKHGSPTKKHMPDSDSPSAWCAKLLKPTRDEQEKVHKIDINPPRDPEHGHGQPNNDPPAADFKTMNFLPKCQLSIENPREDESRESQPTKMRSPLLLETSAAFTPPRARARAYSSVDSPPMLSPLFDSDDDTAESPSHGHHTVAVSGSSTPFSAISPFDEDINGGKLDANGVTPFIVTPEPYVPSVLCPIEDPTPRKLFRVLPPCTGAPACACHKCSPFAITPDDVDYAYLAEECILCTRADFELESDSEIESDASSGCSEDDDEDERYFPEIVIETACRPGDSTRVDDFLSLDTTTPDSVRQLAFAQRPSSQEKPGRKCVHRIRMSSNSASRLQPTSKLNNTKQHTDLGHVCAQSQEKDCLEEKVPDTGTPHAHAHDANKRFTQDVIDEFQEIFMPHGMIAWTTYTSEVHQGLKLHAKKALLDYMKRDFTAAKLSTHNCHCANCHDTVLAMRTRGTHARCQQQQVVHQNQNRHTNHTQLSPSAVDSQAPLQSTSTASSTRTASACAKSCHDSGGGSTSETATGFSGRGRGRGRGSAGDRDREGSSCEEAPMATNGSGATFAYGAKRGKFSDGLARAAEDVV